MTRSCAATQGRYGRLVQWICAGAVLASVAAERLMARIDANSERVGVAKANVEPFVPRVTLTFPALASTHEMLFLVDSSDKRQILGRILAGEDLPAHRAYAQGDLVWLIIRAAAPER